MITMKRTISMILAVIVMLSSVFANTGSTFAATGTSRPGRVTGVKASVKEEKITVSWKKAKHAKSYRVWIKKGSAKWTVLKKAVKTRKLTYTAKENGEYYFRIKGINRKGITGKRYSKAVKADVKYYISVKGKKKYVSNVGDTFTVTIENPGNLELLWSYDDTILEKGDHTQNGSDTSQEFIAKKNGSTKIVVSGGARNNVTVSSEVMPSIKLEIVNPNNFKFYNDNCYIPYHIITNKNFFKRDNLEIAICKSSFSVNVGDTLSYEIIKKENIDFDIINAPAFEDVKFLNVIDDEDNYHDVVDGYVGATGIPRAGNYKILLVNSSNTVLAVSQILTVYDYYEEYSRLVDRFIENSGINKPENDKISDKEKFNLLIREIGANWFYPYNSNEGSYSYIAKCRYRNLYIDRITNCQIPFIFRNVANSASGPELVEAALDRLGIEYSKNPPHGKVTIFVDGLSYTRIATPTRGETDAEFDDDGYIKLFI